MPRASSRSNPDCERKVMVGSSVDMFQPGNRKLMQTAHPTVASLGIGLTALEQRSDAPGN